jgi:hypothetical protein
LLHRHELISTLEEKMFVPARKEMQARRPEIQIKGLILQIDSFL